MGAMPSSLDRRPAKRARTAPPTSPSIPPSSPQLLSEIYERLNCIVCLELMLPPLRTCTQGHSVCEACLRELRRRTLIGPPTCPTCRTPLDTLARNLTLEQLAADITVNCPDGCGASIAYGQLREHRDACGNAPVACPLLSPCAEGKLRMDPEHLVAHLRERHSASVDSKGDGLGGTRSFWVSDIVAPGAPLRPGNWGVDVFDCGVAASGVRQLFVLQIQAEREAEQQVDARFYMRMLATPAVARQYEYTLRFSSAQMNLVWTAPMPGVASPTTAELIKADQVLRLSSQQFQLLSSRRALDTRTQHCRFTLSFELSFRLREADRPTASAARELEHVELPPAATPAASSS